MPVKELKKISPNPTSTIEKKVEDFIVRGGEHVINAIQSSDDHRLTLRIPKWLINKIDSKRKNRIGTISRNLWILETLDKATKK